MVLVSGHWLLRKPLTSLALYETSRPLPSTTLLLSPQHLRSLSITLVDLNCVCSGSEKSFLKVLST